MRDCRQLGCRCAVMAVDGVQDISMCLHVFVAPMK